MSRFFNTTGPCRPEEHYMLPPEDRLVRAQLNRYIESKLYWVLHAPRQTGKTTFLQSWMHQINDSGQAVACYVSVEVCQEFPDANDAIPAICNAIRDYAATWLDPAHVPQKPTIEATTALSAILTEWAKLVAPKPLVVLFDEVDVLQDQAMISFLRQLRSGFAKRGIGQFPVSVALVGMRDLRDYLVQSKDGIALNPGSPFNIKEDSASLSNFTQEDVFVLAKQHIKETGQSIADEALDLVFEYTQGQPWLTNALLKLCVWTICPSGEPVTSDHIHKAREMLIQQRAVHLDSLAERLRDPRVKRIVQTIMIGETDPQLTEGDDFRLCLDLGLVAMVRGTPGIANPIYREVIARVLSQGMQDAIPEPEFSWQTPDGTLDMDAILKEFQKFWRRNGDLWEEKADYTEAFPHLLLMAFLQRVVNGGGLDAWPSSDNREAISRPGRVEREYAAGRSRMDLGILFGGQWTIIEIKLVHPRDGRETTVAEGLEQIIRYRNTIDESASCYLIVFDRTPTGRQKPWDQRLSWNLVRTPTGPVRVVGA